MKTRCWIILIGLVLSIGLAGCGKGGGKSESNLEKALAMLPADTSEFYFTDWALIKETEGFADLSSQDSFERRWEFMRQAFVGSVAADPPVRPRHTTANSYGLNHFQEHAENWGWDNTDLVWETNGIASGPPFYVLQFPKGFDFAPLIARLEERGFSQSEYQGATIYSHDMNLKEDWIRTTEMGILNTAMLEDEKILMMSTKLETVQTLLDTYRGDARSLVDSSAVEASVEALGQVAAALIATGVKACIGSGSDISSLIGGKISEEQLAQLEERFQQIEGLHVYDTLGVGYRYEDEKLIGLIVMHYPQEADAQADLEPRQKLAQEGISLQVKQPYSEVMFTVDEASVKGNSLILQVSPVDGMPRRLFTMFMSRDMIFAVCP